MLFLHTCFSKRFNTILIPYLLFGFAPILLGGIIYLLLRPYPAYFMLWMQDAATGALIEQIRLHTVLLVPLLPSWFIYSLPNGVWAFSYTFIITSLWYKQKSKWKWFWFVTMPVVVFGYEGLQYIGLIRGMFCHVDLLFCLLGLLTAMLAAIIVTLRRVQNV